MYLNAPPWRSHSHPLAMWSAYLRVGLTSALFDKALRDGSPDAPRMLGCAGWCGQGCRWVAQGRYPAVFAIGALRSLRGPWRAVPAKLAALLGQWSWSVALLGYAFVGVGRRTMAMLGRTQALRWPSAGSQAAGKYEYLAVTSRSLAPLGSSREDRPACRYP